MIAQKNMDHGMRLLVAEASETFAYGSVKHVHDFHVTWNRKDPSRLRFKTFKDAPGADELQGDIELIVELWEPWTRKWIQPPNSRFVIDDWKEDLADETNLIEYSAVQLITMLDKVVLHRRAQDHALNIAMDNAEKAFNDAEREFDSAWKTYTDLASRVRQRHGMWGGQNFAQAGFAASTRSRRIPNGSIAVAGWRANNRWNGGLYYFGGGKWKRLSMTKWRDDKDKMIEDGLNVIRKRRVMNVRREELRKTTWAARESSRGGRRYFHNRSAGFIMWNAMVEGQRRDIARGFTGYTGTSRIKGNLRSFTNAKDSRGRNWAASTRSSMEFQVGQGAFSMLQDLQERGLCDWQTRNNLVDIVPHGALRVNRSSKVAIRLGQEVAEAVTNGSRMEHASAVLVVGEGGRAYEYRAGSTSNTWTPWGYWEGSIGESSAPGSGSARRLTAEKRSEMSKRFKLEPSRKVVIGANSPLPMVDYQPHHTISVYESSGNRANRVVEQIIITQSDATSPIEAVITFEDRFQSTPVRFKNSLSKTMGGIDHMQGRIPLDQTPRVDPDMEAELRPTNIAPPISSVAGSVRFDAQGQPHVALKITWEAGYEAEAPPIPDHQLAELVEEAETNPEDDGFIEE